MWHKAKCSIFRNDGLVFCYIRSYFHNILIRNSFTEVVRIEQEVTRHFPLVKQKFSGWFHASYPQLERKAKGTNS